MNPLYTSEFTKLWCYVKTKNEVVSGVWNFTNGLFSEGSPVLTESDLPDFSNLVYVDTPQNITGAKTFTQPVVVPNATSSTQAINKGQADSLYYPLSGDPGSFISSLTGDGTASGPGAAVFTLATVNGTPGVINTAANTLNITTNTKGLITNIVSLPILIVESQVTGLVSDLAGKQATIGYTTENVANKVTTLDNSTTHYPSTSAIVAALSPYSLLDSGSGTQTYNGKHQYNVGPIMTFGATINFYNSSGTSTTSVGLASSSGNQTILFPGGVSGTIALVGGSGVGTVTSLTDNTTNGVTITWNSRTTTPVPTISLGAITPISTNGVSAATMAFLDATSSVQTQINNRLTTSIAASTYIPISGGTFSGPVYLSADAISAMQPITYNQFLNWNNGLNWKHSVRASTTTTLPSYATSSDFLTLTATSNGAFPVIDGVTLTSGIDTILVKNEISTARTNNGGYLLIQQGDSTHPWILVRQLDSQTSLELEAATYYIREGSSQANQVYSINVSPVTLGTTQLTFALTAGAGTYTSDATTITQSGNMFSLNTTYTDARYLTLATPNQTIVQSPTFQNNVQVLGFINAARITDTELAGYNLVTSTSGGTLQLGTSLQYNGLGGLQTGLLVTTDITTAKLGVGTVGGSSGAIVGVFQTVETSITTPRGVIFSQYSNTTNSSRLSLQKSRGTPSSKVSINTADVLGNLIFEGYDGTQFTTGAQFRVTSTGTISSGVVQSTMELMNANSSGVLKTLILLDGNQNIALGQNSNYFIQDNTTTPTTLSVNTNLALSINTNGDFTGTNSGNGYGQFDMYLPNSLVGSLTTDGATQGYTVSTSRGIGTSPIQSNTGDFIGHFSGWAAQGASSPAYTPVAGAYIYTSGSSTNNLGGEYRIYTKGDGGSLTQRVTINNQGFLGVGVNSPVSLLSLAGNISAAAWGSTGINLNIAAATYTDTTSSGTQGTTTGINVIGIPTVNTTNTGVTYTTVATLIIGGAPVAGTNTPVFTNTYGLIVNGKTMLSGGFQTNATSTSSNLLVPTSSSASSTNAAGIPFVSGTVNYRVALNGGNPTTIGIGNSYANLVVGSANITTPTTGTNALLTSVAFNPIGIVTPGGSIITNTSVLYINGQSASGVNNYGILLQSANIAMAGSSSGVITTAVQAASGTYTLTLPSGTPTTGQVMAYGTPMTWVTPVSGFTFKGSGTAVLSSGTVAVTVSGVTSSSTAYISRTIPSGASLTIMANVVCTTNTITITADLAAGTINTADGSTYFYIVIN